jgi:NADH-quinone oxidoreductase subunit M
MSDRLFLPLIGLSILLPLAASIAVWRLTSVEKVRRWSAAVLAVSFTALLSTCLITASSAEKQLTASAGQWFLVDALNAIPLALFAALCLGVTILAPKYKLTPQWLASVLWLSGTTSMAYAANNLLIFILGWAGSLAPFLLRWKFALPKSKTDFASESTLRDGLRDGIVPAFSGIVLSLSLISLCIGIALLIYAGTDGGWLREIHLTSARRGDTWMLLASFAFLMGAVVLRKGLFPFHSWVVTAFEHGPLLPLTLLVNDHLGAFLVARIVLPLLPDQSQEFWSLLSNLSLLTAAYAALLALVQRNPRRLFALVAISQSAFLLTGLKSNSQVGITGALVLWQVVSVSTTMLAAVYSGLEARLGSSLETNKFLGLAAGAPRLAVFFAAGGLALVGLPLTLGFPAEDLLLQGTLAASPWLGVILPMVTAMNAFSVMRLFARLFLGHPVKAADNLADALPRERWILTAALLFLLLGGLFPSLFLRLPSLAAERLAGSSVRQPQVSALP